jgi:hypothetical protein
MPKSATALTALSADELRSIVSYDPGTGSITWRVYRNAYGGKVIPGTPAGRLDRNGYRVIVINGLVYWSGRLAWYLYYGVWPRGQIDHINMDFTDDRITNLREATMTQQRGNQRVRRDSRSGLKGVRKTPEGRWSARVRYAGVKYYLGRFDTPEEAHAAYVAASKRLFGEFARAE